MIPVEELLEPVQRLQASIRDATLAACARQDAEDLAQVDGASSADTIYRIDRIAEEALVEAVQREIASRIPVILIAEGLPEGQMVLPRGTAPRDAAYRVIIDPIDGTRVLMYQKRSAWILTGVAPNRGERTCLRDIVLAVQTEIPLVKQHLGDVLWAVRGGGARGRRVNRFTGEVLPLALRPSRAATLAHGFAAVARFFPGGRDVLAALDEAIVQGACGPRAAGDTPCFEDQYTSTGGQLYGLLAGQDRFIADVRPLLARRLAARGEPMPHCCHPYDICTELIAREAGVFVGDAAGSPLDAPLDVTTDVHWIGYANAELRTRLEPIVQTALRSQSLWPDADAEAGR